MDVRAHATGRITGPTALCVLLALTGCAGTIKQDQRVRGDVSKVEGVTQVVARMSPDATRQQADNPQFNREELANFLRRRLEGRGLMAPAASHRVDVVITDIRIRSGFSAIMFGVLAGDDHVNGRVRILDAQGQALRSFEVTASYALGGIGAGQDGTRMNWLYDKFSQLAADELEKVITPPAGAQVAAALPAAAAVQAAPALPVIPSAASLPSTNVAVDNVDAVPGNDRTHQQYKEWLARKPPRAFVVADGGRSNWAWGNNPKDPMEPRDPLERAMRACQAAGKINCTPYAVDFRVVYVKPANAPPQ